MHNAVARSRCAVYVLAVICIAPAFVGCSGSINRDPGVRNTQRDAGIQKRPVADAAMAPSGNRGTDSGVLLTADDAGPSQDDLAISPGSGTLVVDSALKPVNFSLQHGDGTLSKLPVRWTVDRRELGAIDANSGTFTPSGAGGSVIVTASSGSVKLSVTVKISVRLKQEGDPDVGKLQSGSGGLGGVGGEGPGAALSSGPLRAALDASAEQDSELVWLYPYDGTVWPRGLPAPLLQWKHGAHAPLAVKLQIEVDDTYRAEVYLGAPSALPAMQPIDRLPIPQAIWKSALQSGQHMTVAMTAAVSDGSTGAYKAYAAASKLSWSVAPTTLKGVVYYNSYGTKLAENFDGAQGGNGRFGGATLAIAGDSFDPKLVAGSNSADASGCRVCHVVSANGSRLISQHGTDYAMSSRYDLRNMDQETMYTAGDSGKFGWAALSPDGSIALGSAGPPGSITAGVSSLPQSALYNVDDGSVLTANGLNSVVTQAATPSFASDASMVAFNLYQGPGAPGLTADGRSLVVMDVKRVDDHSYDFSNARAVFTSDASDHKPGWPFFLPDNSGVVFQLELGNYAFETWHGATGELWWTDLHGSAHALDLANGKGYLPSGANGHDADTTLQYEPTVAPIVAGGYAWVVFTSRRLYGNVATRAPFESDPRNADLSASNPQGPTTKKLWVSALSIPAKPGTDPSHPAFYLPAQELYAGNSRGFWALEACKEDTTSCVAGDECCGGYCHIDAEFGVGSCSSTPPTTCSNEFDKCNVTADCCPARIPLTCVSGRCAVIGLQ